MTRDKAFLQYEEALAQIAKESHEASDKARETLRKQLKVLRDEAHTEWCACWG